MTRYHLPVTENRPKRATAIAHPNIALVKYWGKADIEGNMPAVNSLSITLDGLTTTTTVTFDPRLDRDTFLLAGREAPKMAERVSACLDRMRSRADEREFARVESDNDFPTAAGLASSASGFAALVVAADAALATEIERAELADLARQASGSAARSLYGGFAEIELTDSDGVSEATTRQILSHDAWPLQVVVAVTEAGPKDVGSTEGMVRTEQTSPYYGAWVASSRADLEEARTAVAQRDFSRLAEISESSCLKMHAVMLSARPGLVYWNGATVEGIRVVRKLRGEGVPVFFTIDAGPQLKAVCLPEAHHRVAQELARIPGVDRLIESGLGEGARVVEDGR
jgi:diphosphomevalonate decarboxylase